MDEVDIDGEDFNELESRLYGQIHHEAVDGVLAECVNAVETQQLQNQAPENESVERIVTERSVVNRPAKSSRVPDTRYWVNSAQTVKTANTYKPIESPIPTAVIAANQNQNENEKLSINIPAGIKEVSDQSNKNDKDNEQKVQRQPPTNDIVQQVEPQEQQKPEKDISSNKNLRINPAAVVKNTKPNFKNKKQKTPQEHVPRSGPFMQQENKLQKALLIQDKKKKSKRVRNKNRKKQKPVETIVLESSSENSSGTDEPDDDVVLIPAKPPPLITLSDSDTEANGVALNEIQPEGENAIDASDVFMDKKKKSSNFIIPTDVRNNVAQEAHEKQLEQISSRCTSPCSVLSSDDFIGQTDRSRLLEDNCMADDQDLAVLTADVDSLMQPPQQKHKSAKQIGKQTNTSLSEDVICIGQFSAPLSSTTSANERSETLENQKKSQNNYRVEQTEFRAMDVYESESDITDSVYSKGTRRPRTIINAVDTSSEGEDVQQASINQKVKRFCKRRTSSSNRGSDALHDDTSTDDELNEDGVSKTPISFIMRGTAVERNNKKLRKRTQSLSFRRASAGGKANPTGNMSDTEFIATLNSLVQGREDNINKDIDDKNDEVENSDSNKNTIQALEKSIPKSGGMKREEPDRVSLQSVQIIEPPLPAHFAEAVPDDALAGLDKIFDSIDNMIEPTSKFQKKPSESENSSEDEIEVIQPPVPAPNRAEERENKNALPIGHIVYTEGILQPGGVGWKEEMAKFYNSSWHGERFSVIAVQNGMDKDRSLWKIYTEDRFPKTRPYSNLKCYNCCEFGHTRAKCRRPKKPPVCYMCGESGHFEPRCPNTICLRCGSKTQVFTKSCNSCTFQNRLICPICKVRGHSINLCPDKWRRYHSTTRPNAHPNTEVEFNKRKMCCVCGASGHFSDTCRSAVRFMDYPVIVSYVKSHQKSYNDPLFSSPRIGLALNLLYKPGDTVIFHMAEKTKPNGYYGRFLKAVGLGNLLPRKRPSNCLAVPEKPSKQARNLSGHYELNPYGRAARANARTASDVDNRNKLTEEAAPNQVQEVSGSVISDEAVTSGALEEVSTGDDMDVTNTTNTNEANETTENNRNEVEVSEGTVIEENEFKTPGETSAVITTHQPTQHKDNLAADSDSNYSFSDHFEIEPTAVRTENKSISNEDALDAQPSTSAAARSMLAAKRVREMDPLPDFIPITDISDANTSEMVDNFDTQTGISRRFVAADTDDEQESETAQTNDTPCEAKIYLTHFHSNYLLSPDGHEFLVQKSKECNIKARLDWTSVGHVLVIFGLANDQDIFHKALLDKCRDLMDQINNKQLSAMKVPKRIDALIRFLRENLSQLQSDLGDVNDLQRRITNLEKSHTKANMKLAEKFRRLLNMILLGQAGLCGGDKHLDKLLMNLKSLINDYQAENMVPQSLREEIDSHSKLIFTSYRHENYPELIQTYNRMSKIQKNSINIDPLLMGQKLLDVSLTPEQRARLEQPSPAGSSAPATNQTPSLKKAADNNESNSPNGNKSKMVNKSNESMQQIQSQAKISNEPASFSKGKNKTQTNSLGQSPVESAISRPKSNTSMPIKRLMVVPPPFTKPQQKSTAYTKTKEAAEHQNAAVNDILSGDSITSAVGAQTSGTKRAPSKGPSVFWSRESMRYLDECIQMAESNMELLSKLQRIQLKSAEGALSYNDYRAVIKLHGAMVGH